MGQTVGVIGLGNMGRGIAKNIALAGNTLLVWDINENVRASYAETARIATPVEMATEAEVVIFVVPGSTQIESMLPDASAAIANANADAATATTCQRRRSAASSERK